MVQEGTGATNTACAGFSATGAVVFDSSNGGNASLAPNVPAGSLTDLTTNRTSYATARSGSWMPSPSTSRSYRFTVTYVSSGSDSTDNSMQGSSLSTTFVWESHTS